MGHHLGLDHSDSREFMQQSLGLGVRNIVESAPNDLVAGDATQFHSFVTVTRNQLTGGTSKVARNQVSTPQQTRIADFLFGASDAWVNVRREKSAARRQYAPVPIATSTSIHRDKETVLSLTTRSLAVDDEVVLPRLSKVNRPFHTRDSSEFDDVDHVFAEFGRGRSVARWQQAAAK
jgi:hypothetical protein